MNKLARIISNSNSIAITSHIDPDGDSIGSMLALWSALRQKCRNVEAFIDDVLPRKYDFLPQSKYVKKYKDVEGKDFDLFFALDCGNKARLGHGAEAMENSKIVVNIDHHISNTEFGDINIIDINSSSTCEMIYSIIKDMGLIIDKQIATCIYVGIVTDSGNFMYDNVTEKTHLIVADLMKTDIAKQDIIYNLYQKKSINSLRFLGYSLTNMDVELGGRLAIFQISSDLLKKFNIPGDDVESLVNYGRDIEGIDIAVTMMEKGDNKVKLSFRSKHDDIDVRALAQLFNGGGHKKASGAMLNSTLDEARNQVIEKAKQFVRR
ncbi:MAG: DHH family phosphoesterase [Natronincolaceae bacterium]|nr:bifunctional oligoribonuclease/PAP phosphatase NrnA [Bacillota bacterium]NLK90794.1 bifunctional oligoribonuclease/PAP phosphatase NrnA [Clostridiales bacterium]